MRKPFEANFPITQIFGVNPDMYKKFGLLGHNGIDYGIPTGTKVLAPHNGKIIEATLDPNGYGLYLKIENSIEGSVLGHNKELRVGVGDVVDEGQLIALSDNSGNSTGPHLHWGYYRLPRDRQNGYAGFIDQTSYLNNVIPDQALQACQTSLADEIKKKNDLYNEKVELANELDGLNSQIRHYTDYEKQLASLLNCAVDEAVILGEITKAIGNGDQLREALKLVETLKSSEAQLTQNLAQSEQTADNCLLANKSQGEALHEATDKAIALQQKIDEMAVSSFYVPITKIISNYYLCRKEVKK